METFLEVLNSQNFGKVCIIVIILFLFFGYAVQKGWLRGKFKSFTIGNDDERKIIREQLIWTKSELDVYFNDLINANRDNPKFQKQICLFCKLRIYVILSHCIALNHISTDDVYVEGVVHKIWGDLTELELSDRFITQEFREEQKKEVEKIIKKLVEIRAFYQKGR